MNKAIWLFSLIFVTSWPAHDRFFVNAAATFPRIAINVRRMVHQTNPSQPSFPAAITTKSSASAVVATRAARKVPSESRGGAAAAVKTMTARQMEAFK